MDGVLGVPAILKQERKKGPDNVAILHLLMEEHNALDQIKRKLFVKVKRKRYLRCRFSEMAES